MHRRRSHAPRVIFFFNSSHLSCILHSNLTSRGSIEMWLARSSTLAFCAWITHLAKMRLDHTFGAMYLDGVLCLNHILAPYQPIKTLQQSHIKIAVYYLIKDSGLSLFPKSPNRDLRSVACLFVCCAANRIHAPIYIPHLILKGYEPRVAIQRSLIIQQA